MKNKFKINFFKPKNLNSCEKENINNITEKYSTHTPTPSLEPIPSNDQNENDSDFDAMLQYKKKYFKQYIPKQSKYHNQKPSKRILWPFIVVLPIFFISIITNMITEDPSSVQDGTQKELATTSKDQTKYNNDLYVKEIKNVFNIIPHKIPVEIQNTIFANVDIFVKDLYNLLESTPPDLLLLVDKQHPLPKNYVPTNLTALHNYKSKLFLNKDNLQLKTLLIEPLINMTNTAKTSSINLAISSAYRSYNYQNTIFNRITKELGLKEALRQSARPGTSQHQLGTTLDFGSIDAAFASSDAGVWLKNNAWQYGFSLSYPENQESVTGYIYESWHFRYLGKFATIFEQSYFQGQQQYMIEFIYYIPKNSILTQLI